MIVLTSGIANTIDYYRSVSGVTIVSAQIIDPLDGSVLATPVVTNDTADTAITAAIAAGSYEFTAPNIVKGRKYIIEHDPADSGTSQVVDVIAVDTDGANKNEIKFTFLWDMDLGSKVKGLYSSISYTPSAEQEGDTVWILLVDSNGETIRKEAVVVKYRSTCPVTSADILQRWSRLSSGALPSWQKRKQVSWQPQVDEAWEQIRSDFWSNGKILDQVVSTDSLRELVFAYTANILMNMGINPTGAGSDLADQQSKSERFARSELIKALTLPLAVDTSQDNISDGDKYAKGLKLDGWSY